MQTRAARSPSRIQLDFKTGVKCTERQFSLYIYLKTMRQLNQFTMKVLKITGLVNFETKTIVTYAFQCFLLHNNNKINKELIFVNTVYKKTTPKTESIQLL